MGIDWFPFKPRPGADPNRIAILARIQEAAFQAMPEMWSKDPLPAYSREQHERDQQSHADLNEEAVNCRRLAHRWHRNTKNCHCGHFALYDFAKYLESVHEPLLDQFFAWARKWESRRYGLYLDY